MKRIAVFALSIAWGGASAQAAPGARPKRNATPRAVVTARPNARPAQLRTPTAHLRVQPQAVPRPAKTEISTWKVGTGSQHRLVFLHGLGGTPEGPMIKSIVRGLEQYGVSAEFKAPLLREVRRSLDGTIVSESTQTMSEQLRHAREAIRSQPGKVVLFGHSFGAKATLQLAKEFPDKISAIIAIAPSVKMMHAYWKRISGERGLAEPARMGRVLDQYQRRIEEHLAAARDPLVREQIAESLKYHKVMRDLLHYNEAALELHVKVPMLVFQGAKDQAVSIHYVRRFAQANKKVKLVTYEHGDHHLLGETAQETKELRRDVARRVSEFLAQQDAAP